MKKILQKYNKNLQQLYKDFIIKRDKQKEKDCYCGHTTDCTCDNPSFLEFKHNLLANNIREKSL